MKRTFSFILYLVSCILISSCGKGSSTPTSEYTTGSSINMAWDVEDITCSGDYVGKYVYSDYSNAANVHIQTVTACANVLNRLPSTFKAVTSLPTGFRVNTSEGDENVTSAGTYGVAYTFTLNGTSGYMTGSSSNATITLPFKTGSVPSGDTDSTKVFMRIYNYDDSSLVDLAGEISEGGLISVTLFGLPSQFTAGVIYNPYMDAAESSVASSAKSSWSVQRWCVIYNWHSSSVKSAVKAKGGYSDDPTRNEIYNTIRTYVADAASTAQDIYEDDGFDPANLYTASKTTDPCGSYIGSNSRYEIRLSDPGPSFAHTTFSQVIRPEANKYGRIFINPSRISDSAASSLGSVTAAIAQELFYFIADAYGLYSGVTTKGYREGIAVLYGMTIDSGSVKVRSASTDETKMMSDFLSVDQRNNSDTVSHANQDFFAYVANKYNNGDLSYVSGLFEIMNSNVSELSTEGEQLQPPRSTLFGAMNTSFRSQFSSYLKDIFLDFFRQRVFDHDTESQFGRSGETTSGFASNIFQSSTSDDTWNSLAQITIDAGTCGISSSKGGFSDVVPYAVRVVRITPSTAADTGVTVTVSLSPSAGGIGGSSDEWNGFTYSAGVSGSLSSTNTFSSFGTALTDETIVAVANITNNVKTFINYSITCAR